MAAIASFRTAALPVRSRLIGLHILPACRFLRPSTTLTPQARVDGQASTGTHTRPRTVWRQQRRGMVLRMYGRGCPPCVQGGGGNPFANMGNLMENVKKAQMMVQQETARVQQELQEYVVVFRVVIAAST